MCMICVGLMLVMLLMQGKEDTIPLPHLGRKV